VAAEPASTTVPGPNPSQRLDPLLGIIVLQFQDGEGKTVTLPTQRMLAAYRLAGGPFTAEHASSRPAAKAAPTPEAPAPAAPAPAAPAPEAAAPEAAAPTSSAPKTATPQTNTRS
jgi:hypothetical protein